MTVEAIEVLDLFSAACGGWSLGLHRAGFTTIAACEVKAWRRAIYAENNPDVRIYDDVRTLTANRLLADLGRLPAIVVGSPPCQDISSANTSGKGVEGARSGLYFEAIRIIGECRPRWFALENSANLRTRGADAVIAALEAIGYTCWPTVVRAGDIGANHERPRCWLIGCDLGQIDDPAGFPGGAFTGVLGRPDAFDTGGDAAYSHCNGQPALSLDGEMAVVRRMGADREPRDAADASRERQFAWAGSSVGAGRAHERHEPADLPGDPDLCDQAAYAACPGHAGWSEVRSGREARDQHAGNDACTGAGPLGGGDAANPDQAGQADGCLVTGIRQAEVADDGRGTGWCADEPCTGQMGVCPADRGAAHRSGPDWSLSHLADHLRVDDGLSAWLAGQRIAIGDGKGQSAASLIVEAFGDAVIPQIPEAIGRAILRTERALAVAYGRAAA